MRQSVFDYIDNLDTLLAVIVGALLATGGAMVAELVQDRLGQKRRERDAARFFGEILTSVDRVIERAVHSMQFGERWGEVTQRLFRTALNETSVYERNRERLFEISDLPLRREIHTHFLTETVPLVALLESCEEIKVIERELKSGTLDNNQRAELEAELEELNASRERALEAVQDAPAQTLALCSKLQPIAGIAFDH